MKKFFDLKAAANNFENLREEKISADNGFKISSDKISCKENNVAAQIQNLREEKISADNGFKISSDKISCKESNVAAQIQNLREDKISADNGFEISNDKISCNEFIRAAKFLYQVLNFDLKASNFNAGKFSVKVGIFIPKKNLNAATAIFGRNTGISKFLNQTKNIR